MCNSKRHHLFAAQMLIGPLIFGSSGLFGGTGGKKAERRLEMEGAHYRKECSCSLLSSKAH